MGVQLQPQHAKYEDIRRAAAHFEELGVDVLFNWDHFYPLSGDSDGLHFECWTMLAAWAEATEKVEIGALVTCNSYRNPNLLADLARTVDHISEGRLILGIGSGWCQKDYDHYGYEFGTAGSRLNDLARDLPVIEERLEMLNPQPTRKIPVLIGGGGEKKTLKLVVQHADIWHGFGDADQIAHKHHVLDDWCATVGRDPNEIERSTGVSALRGRDGEAAGLDIGANAQAKYDIGTRLFTLGLDGPDYDDGLVKDLLAWRDDVNRRNA